MTLPALIGKYEQGFTSPKQSIRQIDWAAMHPLPPPVEKVRLRRVNCTPSAFDICGTMR